jgi:hypothetical protein
VSLHNPDDANVIVLKGKAIKRLVGHKDSYLMGGLGIPIKGLDGGNSSLLSPAFCQQHSSPLEEAVFKIHLESRETKLSVAMALSLNFPDSRLQVN